MARSIPHLVPKCAAAPFTKRCPPARSSSTTSPRRPSGALASILHFGPHMKRLALSAVPFAFVSSVADAQPVLATAAAATAGSAGSLLEEAPRPAPATEAAFATLDPHGSTTGMTLALATQRMSDRLIDVNGELGELERYTLARLGVHGQWVNARGYGGYASLPLLRVEANDYAQSALGSLELGLVSGRGRGTLRNVVRVGMVVPTAQSPFLPGGGVAAWGTLVRPSDYATGVSGTWLRLSTSPMLARGRWLARADVGVDVALDDATDFAGIGRANLGIAAVLGQHQLGVEGTFQVLAGDGFAEYSHTVGLSYRLRTPTSPFFAVYKRKDGGFIDESLVLSAGLSL